MGYKCVVCGIKKKNAGTLSFHSFPKDADRKKLWMDSCKLKLYLPSYKICSKHFNPEEYAESGYLKKDAVPMHEKLKLPTNEKAQCFKSSDALINKIEIEIKVENPEHLDLESITVPDNQKTPPPTMRRKLFNSDTIGDLDICHFDTPEKARRHLDMVKSKYKSKQIQNHNLKKQINRLKTKLAKYEELVKKNTNNENTSYHKKL